MRNADAGLELRGVGPQGCEVAERPLGKRVAGRMERAPGSTPFRPCGARGSLDKIGKTEWLSPRRGGERSIAAARNVWASESIRQKIIGHRMAVCGSRFGGGLVRSGLGFRGENRAFALLDQPAGDHGVAGSGEQEFPGRLGAIGVHGAAAAFAEGGIRRMGGGKASGGVGDG